MYKAYILGFDPDVEKIKINVRIYDDQEPVSKEITDSETGEKTIVMRDEYAEVIYVPYGQPEDYIKDRVREVLNKYKSRLVDIQKLQSLKDRNEQIE